MRTDRLAALPAAVLAAAAASLLAAGCAHAGAPPAAATPATLPAAGGADAAPAPGTPAAAPGGAAAPDPLADLRDAADALLTAQAEAAWRGWTGGEAAGGPAAPAAQALLADPAALERVAAARAAAPEPARPGLDRLRAFLLGERLARETAGPAQALAAARAAATFSWNQRAVPLRQVAALLAAEAEGPRRQALAAAHAAAARKLQPLQAARDAALAAAATRLGFAGTLDLAAALRGEEAGALAGLAEATLARTDATWKALLEGLARRELQTPADRLRARDLPRLLRTTAAPGAFPAARQLADAEALLAPLGLDLAAGGRLTVDAAPRPARLSRPLALPVRVPGDVRLSLVPVAGLDAARALLHELGVAQAAARCGEGPVEDRRLGAAALPEAWGALLAGVAAAPGWLGAHGLDEEAVRREVRVAAARRLLAAREAAAAVLAAVARAREPAAAAARSAALAARAYGLPAEPREPPPWELEPDPLLRAADALQAALLAAQVEAHLAARAGGPWWLAPASGDWLRAAWAEGGRRAPAEVARALGAEGLDPAPLDALVRAAAAAGGLDLGAPAGAAPGGAAAPAQPAKQRP